SRPLSRQRTRTWPSFAASSRRSLECRHTRWPPGERAPGQIWPSPPHVQTRPKEPPMANEKSEGRSTIIAAVQHPIGLLALIVLVVEAVIGVLAVRAEGAAAVKIIWGMIGLLALVIVAVILTVL